MRDEANWIDFEKWEERPFMLDGRRVSFSDIEELLELAVKTKMASESQIISSWL